ncbi:hypothetical protein HK096_007760, partial [Nowakowskiella sp. JEL0078]
MPCQTTLTLAGRFSNVKVNVTGFSQDPVDGEKPLYEACSKALAIDFVWKGPANAANPFLRQCDLAKERTLTWVEPEFAFFYALGFAIIVVAGSHAVYKKISNGNFKEPISLPTRSRSFKSMSHDENEMELQD